MQQVNHISSTQVRGDGGEGISAKLFFNLNRTAVGLTQEPIIRTGQQKSRRHRCLRLLIFSDNRPLSIRLLATRREQDDIADGWRIGQQHDQTVHADAEATGWRHALVDGVEELVV
ncbi:hypothetical protein DSM25558_4231 [Agrobacterium sp. DSM 25558]|nr:hypothetical protein DSM25558_4231 [Agrobacterium sp. DSM 25558]